MLAAKARIMENVFGPSAAPSSSHSAKSKRRTSSARRSESEKHRQALAYARNRAASAAAKALAGGKTRKQLRGNAKFLANAGLLPNRLAIGAPLAKVEGTGYHLPTIALSRRQRTRKI